MPELPEVDSLVGFLREQAVGAVLVEIELASFSVLKTYDPPISAFAGLTVTDVTRHGKFIDVDVDGLHLIVHLAKAGWLRWSDKLADTKLKMGNGPLALGTRASALVARRRALAEQVAHGPKVALHDYVGEDVRGQYATRV
ncbi:MAG: DNA-formamidopyrimidine glycosylase family protein, partial [Aeromicrobium sp.]